ncbi:MAG: helix-turn-helix domain-containing protein [Alphaproteobacteria bacterium]|nr:helix-turn-helix domain-containing protein [Alphaproteobacteria bacterium]
MAVGLDFARKLDLVLKTLNLSRARLAQSVGVDKSVVSRWASGVSVPTDHNLSLLTEAVSRHKADFGRRDWDLEGDEFAVRLGIATPASKEPALALPDKPSIAVLPFHNMSGDPEQEYFADGMVEDIITALSRSRDFFVIARNSSLAYKGGSPDVRQVGRELGVRYVLEGSVRKAGNRLRIAAQLIEAATGKHLWAERYDCEATDIFTVQDEIAENVVGSLEPQILLAEGGLTRRQKPADLDAWGYVTRAFAHRIVASRHEMQTALDLLERAIECDPSYARAHAHHAVVQVQMAYQGWLADRTGSFEAAAESARRAIELDASDPWAHYAKGLVASLTRQHGEALASLTTAVELNPNFAMAHSRLGAVLTYHRRAEEGIRHTARALRISPRDPLRPTLLNSHAITLFAAARYAEAAAAAERASQERPGFAQSLRILTSARALLGDIAGARSSLKELQLAQPGITLAWVEKNVDTPDFLRPIYLEGLRLAGLPE